MQGTLARADEIINGERQDSYGSPEDSFALIAEHWTTYLRGSVNANGGHYGEGVPCGITLDAADVAVMMTLFKIARMSGQKWHPDNAVDACGYLAILNDRLKNTEV